MVTIFPSILPDGESFIDDTYSRAELDRMDGRNCSHSRRTTRQTSVTDRTRPTIYATH
jgi:hypothetical protein